MKMNTSYFKLTSLITLFFFLHSCSIRTLKEVPPERINNINGSNIIVIHANDITFRLVDVSISEGILYGSVSNYEKSKKSDQLYNELHIYADLGEEFTVVKNSKLTIPLENVSKVEVYQFNGYRLTGNIIIGVTSVTLVLIIISAVILYNAPLNPAGSG